MIQKPTFTLKALPESRIQWDAVTKYGQTVKVIMADGRTSQHVLTSAQLWNKKMHPKIRLECRVKAQTFLIFEAVPCLEG